MNDIRQITTYCGVCEHSCGMLVTVRNNAVETIQGLKDHPHSKGYLCPKGIAAKEMLSSPDRLTSPLIKKNGSFHAVSWDDAIDFCCRNLQSVKDRFGPNSLLVYHGQSYLKSRLAYFLMKRFLNLYGTANISSAGSECFISTMLAHFTTFGNLPFPDYSNSSCILLWGTNPPASGGIGKSYPHMLSLLEERKEAGASLIVIDPRKTVSAELADRWLQPRPGTDGALALGFIRTILEENLQDTAYIEKFTSGFEKLQDMMHDYPVQQASAVTGVPEDDIRAAARLFARANPACIKVGSGLEHHTNGVQAIRATNVLLAITGNIDVSGGNTFLSQAPLAVPEIHTLQSSEPLGSAEHPMFVSMVRQAHAVAALDCLESDKPYPIRAMIVAGGAPLSVLANTSKVRRAWEKMEVIISIDQFMNHSVQHADAVLPAALFLEREEITTNPLFLQNRAVEPCGPLPDWDIWLSLAKAMGFGEHFPWQDPQEMIDHLLEPAGVTAADIRNSPGGILTEQPAGAMLRDGFYTYSGKIELFSHAMESNGYDPLPRYTEPHESPVSNPDLHARYPLVLTTGGRYPCYVHSQHRTIPSLRRCAPEPLMEIHPETARSCGVSNGMTVSVESPRGSIVIKAVFTDGILPGVVHIPHGWEPENCNILTDDTARDPVSGFPGLKSSLCRVVPVT